MANAVGADYQLFKTPYGNMVVPVWHMDSPMVTGSRISFNINSNTQNRDIYNHTVPFLVAYGDLTPIPKTLTNFLVGSNGNEFGFYCEGNRIYISRNNEPMWLALTAPATSTAGGMFQGFLLDSNSIPIYADVLAALASYDAASTYTQATATEFGMYYRPDYQFSAAGYISATRVSEPFVSDFNEFIQAWYNYSNQPESDDPYAGAGDSEPVAFPHGDFDYGSDPIGGADRYHIPSVSVVDTGFVTLYNPTIQELKELSNYLWSSTFDLDTFKKIFNNPMDLFIGLSMIPVRVPQGPSKEVGIGMIGSGVYMTTASAQFVLVNCGVCDVPNFSGGYLDYSPYTKVEIYLPYIGFRTLNADEVMGKTLYVQYKVDILSGACTCWIDVLTTIADGTTDLCTTYVFMGECAVSIPLASGDWTNLLNGIIGAAAAVGAGFAAGGAGGAIAGGVSAASSVAVNDSKIHVERSGAITSSAGLMAPQSPYLIISTPHIHKPAEVPYYTGYPAYFTSVLSDLSGFTIIDNIHLSNVPATEPELEEIETLLKGGVIL